MDKKRGNLKKQSSEQKNKETDPQEKMKGPISSIVQDVKEKVEEDDKETKKEADKKKNKNT